MNTATYDSYVRRLQSAWRGEDDDDDDAKHREIPDGTRIRVPMLALDSVQREIAGQAAVDARVADNVKANQAALDAARREADRVQAFADHFTEQREQREREARDENRAYSAYCEALSNGWQTPSNQVAA
jgi:DNA-binding helix-hairpin-helix protein with protein kinase domain